MRPKGAADDSRPRARAVRAVQQPVPPALTERTRRWSDGLLAGYSRDSTARQSTFPRNASMYFGRSAGL